MTKDALGDLLGEKARLTQRKTSTLARVMREVAAAIESGEARVMSQEVNTQIILDGELGTVMTVNAEVIVGESAARDIITKALRAAKEGKQS